MADRRTFRKCILLLDSYIFKSENFLLTLDLRLGFISTRNLNLNLVFLVIILSLFVVQKDAFGGSAMEISSTAFKDGGKIPTQYVMPGAGGKNVSLPLTWRNVPPGTKSFALSIVDLHPVAQSGFTGW